jgi:hypothetical protein
MMRRLFLLSFAAFVLSSVTAGTDKLHFYQNDGVVRYCNYGAVDSISFDQDYTLALFRLGGELTASYHFSMLDSLTFGQSVSNAATFPSALDFNEAFQSTVTPEYNNVPEPPIDADDNDYIENYTVKNTITFTYEGNSVTVAGLVDGVTVTTDGAHVRVVSTKGKMRYLLQGSTENGSFKVATENPDLDEKRFCITLNGLTMTNPNGAAINIQTGKSVYLSLAKDKVNTLCDGDKYNTVPGEDEKGTIFSEGQLLISGSGTLNVKSLGGHGICSDDYIFLRANTGTINITSKKDGLNTKDHFTMYGGTVNINSQRDGIAVREGPFQLYGGTLDMDCIDDGIVSDYTSPDTASIFIAGGYTKITTTDEKGHAVYTTGPLTMTGGAVSATVTGNASKCLIAGDSILISGGYAMLKAAGTPLYDKKEKDYASAACIRAKRDLTISGGDLYLLCSGDGGKAINSVSNTLISGGNITVITQGRDCTINDNTIRSRAVDTEDMTISGNAVLKLSAAGTSIYTGNNLNINGGSTYSLTTDRNAESLNVKGARQQTGGLILFGYSE